jgi:alpha-L-fucosidase
LNLRELFAYYYNKVSEGVINDRFFQVDSVTLAERASAEISTFPFLPDSIHFDFRTPEYASRDKITEEKWESCRGIGYSFGYNRNEGPEDMLSFKDLIHLLVDIVSKNGNLLLDVGPMADGAIPDLQQRRLLELGQWLNINGEAIYATRPWVRADGITDEGIAVRFTQKRDALYAILLGRPKSRKITINSLNVEKDTTVHLLGESEALSWRQAGNDLTITIPKDLTESPAYAFRITPKPIHPIL